MFKYRSALLASAILILLSSCNIIDPPEDIPAILKIDTFKVKVTNFDQGSANHRITCVKVNVGGTTLGFFELPAEIPSLMTGKQALYIEPVIELNGIRASRVVYPFFRPYIGTSQFDLTPGQVISLEPVTTYKDECKFPLIEDFEDAGVAFLYPAYTDTVIKAQNQLVREGHYSGSVFLDTRNRFFEAYTSTDYELPKNGSPVIWEFDYQCNTLIEFGVYVVEDDAAVWNSLVMIRPISSWNRIYIDLNTLAGDNQKADAFRPAFRAKWDSTGAARQFIHFDNIKLIHY